MMVPKAPGVAIGEKRSKVWAKRRESLGSHESKTTDEEACDCDWDRLAPDVGRVIDYSAAPLPLSPGIALYSRRRSRRLKASACAIPTPSNHLPLPES